MVLKYVKEYQLWVHPRFLLILGRLEPYVLLKLFLYKKGCNYVSRANLKRKTDKSIRLTSEHNIGRKSCSGNSFSFRSQAVQPLLNQKIRYWRSYNCVMFNHIPENSTFINNFRRQVSQINFVWKYSYENVRILTACCKNS